MIDKVKDKPDEKLIIYNGELDSRRKILGRGSGFLMPGFMWVVIFLAIPLLYLVVMSFASRGTYGEVVWKLSFDNVKRLVGFGFFGVES